MIWLKKFPWLSFVLLVLTFGIFGWLYGSWTAWLVEQERGFRGLFEDRIATLLIELFGAILVLLMALAFTAPIAIMTLSVGNWIKTEARVFVGLLIASALAVILIYWLQYIARFLLLLVAATLFRLELQTAGCKKRQASFVLAMSCLVGFGCGVLVYSLLGHQNYELQVLKI
jgi:hypothetical protein